MIHIKTWATGAGRDLGFVKDEDKNIWKLWVIFLLGGYKRAAK